MSEQGTFASAEPEKRLFISLLTRDISLVDAVLDLMDNSINAAIIHAGSKLATPDDYLQLLDLEPSDSLPSINISFDPTQFRITDTAGGISFKVAEQEVFRFGREDDDDDDTADKVTDDRLSVYGIGLKRAIFKIGDHVEIKSAHPEDGFTMDLHVRAWGKLKQEKWRIPIDRLPAAVASTFGTDIHITSLFPDIVRRIGDGAFESDLTRRIARTYNYFLGRIVNVQVNGTTIVPIDVNIGTNRASDLFELDGVSCAVVAGIGIPKGKFHTAETAGWYVYCNGRAVAFADKTDLTGWGYYLPNFQPKHRPFVGNVFFTAENPELLPWTTTKASINRENPVWQHALTVMGTVGKQITSYLDSRYTDDGTEITSVELAEVAGAPGSTLRAISPTAQNFSQTPRSKPTTTSIQFKVLIKDVDEARGYLGRRGMSNGEVGRYTFDYFLENVVRE